MRFATETSYGHAPEVHARIRDYFMTLQVPVDRGSITGRTALEARVVHVPDVLADHEYTWGEAQKIGGYRTALGVPLFPQRPLRFIGAQALPQQHRLQIELRISHEGSVR